MRLEFQRLSAIVELLRACEIPRTGVLRYDAALLALSSYPSAPPSMVNVAALALSMERLAVHEISGGAIRMVHDADLRSIPDRPPRLMQRPWIIESADLDAPLWGDTVCLGGYRIDDAYFLVGFRYPDGAVVVKWVPEWGKDDGEIEMPLDRSPLIDNVDGHHEWAQNAARFVLILSLLLEAHGSPLESKTATPGKRKRGERAARARAWVVQRVVLSKLRTQYARPEGVARTPALISDRQPQQTMVRGHLKRIHYGPGSSPIRWQWIDGYEARRWVAPRIRYKISE